MGSRKRKFVPAIMDFSESDEGDNTTQNNVTRSSERIKKKKNKQFHKPTKEEVWQKITPTKSPGKYEDLKPRKLVNNFTKENNRYNYDPNETSGDESMDDFIVDEETDSDSSSDDTSTRKPTPRTPRIHGRRHRLITLSDSDDESSQEAFSFRHTDISQIKTEDKTLDTETSNLVNILPDVDEQNSKTCIENSNKLQGQSTTLVVENRGDILCDIKEEENVSNENVDSIKESTIKEEKESSDSEEEILAPSRKSDTQRHTSMCIESDSDSDAQIISPKRVCKRTSTVIESDDEGDDEGVDESRVDEGVITESLSKDVLSASETQSTVVPTNSISAHNSSIETIVKIEPIEQTVNIQQDTSTQICSGANWTVKRELVKEETATCSIDQSIVNNENSDGNSIECVGSNRSSTIKRERETESECDNEESEDNNNSEVDSDSNTETDSEDTDDTECSGRVRVQMLKKKRAKEKLFEKLRKERQRKLMKGK